MIVFNAVYGSVKHDAGSGAGAYLPGVVKGSDGQPIIGASVEVVGTTVGTRRA